MTISIKPTGRAGAAREAERDAQKAFKEDLSVVVEAERLKNEAIKKASWDALARDAQKIEALRDLIAAQHDLLVTLNKIVRGLMRDAR